MWVLQVRIAGDIDEKLRISFSETCLQFVCMKFVELRIRFHSENRLPRAKQK